ncbi:MAG: 2-phospho-L-lactate transferase, partial [Spirochaetes bacterium]|nr:2-phospho-L-lactate transferase [Spirochaetota bacterium]
VSSMGVARCYEDLIDILVIDERDGADEGDFPMKTVKYDTMMTSVEKSEALAGFVMQAIDNIS